MSVSALYSAEHNGTCEVVEEWVNIRVICLF